MGIARVFKPKAMTARERTAAGNFIVFGFDFVGKRVMQ
jgi:hypothetical protein